MSKWILQFVISGMLTTGLLPAAIAADPITVEHATRAGVEGRIDAAPCILIAAPPAWGTARMETLQDKTEVLLYTPAEKQIAAVVVRLDTGETAKVHDKCPNPTTKDKNHVIQVSGEPGVPPETLEKAFRLLVATFVLGLLLESAFPLRQLLFPSSIRTPPSGGRRARADLCYRITITDRLARVRHERKIADRAGSCSSWALCPAGGRRFRRLAPNKIVCRLVAA
jgi:hypothetical protein